MTTGLKEVLMEPKSIYQKLIRVLAPLTFILSLIIVIVAAFGVGYAVRSIQQRQIMSWRQSLPISLLSHFIASDSVPIKNVAVMAIETGLFKGIKVVTANGMILVEIGSLSGDIEELEVKDENGAKWGSIFLSVDDEAWIYTTIYLAAFLSGALLTLLFIVLLLSRSFLRRELSILDRCINEIESFSNEMILYQGASTNFSAKLVHSQKMTPDKSSSKEHKRLILIVNRLITEVATLAGGIRKSEQEKSDVQAKARTTEAIAQMTQMIVHDVRKPFSMLRAGLNLLQATINTPQKFRANLSFLIAEVDRATQSVNGILNDVLEIGSPSSQLIQEPVAPETLIESSLGEVFRVYPESQISISYDFNHNAMVNVHLEKICRVFANIIGNAVQAINSPGTSDGSLWFKTRMDSNYVRFSIGNSGSFIPSEALPLLFDAFFTSGKKGGTGLGLAIARKVVQAHGGKIWCESDIGEDYPQGRVEFFFTLPVAEGSDLTTTSYLPKHSGEITRIIKNLASPDTQEEDETTFDNDISLLPEIIKYAKSLSRRIGILIVDDEMIYRRGLSNWIDDKSELVDCCEVLKASNSTEALSYIREKKVDLLITDIDMGPGSLSGFELIETLRTIEGYNGRIFVHSNRIVPGDQRRAGDLGADGFLPKPMAKGQLLRILLQTIKSCHNLEESTIASVEEIKLIENVSQSHDFSPSCNFKGSIPQNRLIAIIDDEIFFREQWPPLLLGFETICYSRAEDFIKDWERINDKLVAVITDKYLGSGMDGIQLGAVIKDKHPDLPVILSTNDNRVRNTQGIIDMVVDKEASEEVPKIIDYLATKSKNELSQSSFLRSYTAHD
jgi:signal transduction histidine kinase/CheY-like chemotaxis protein